MVTTISMLDCDAPQMRNRFSHMDFLNAPSVVEDSQVDVAALQLEVRYIQQIGSSGKPGGAEIGWLKWSI